MEQDQFFANTSHELRTPLQGIIGLSESLIERVGPTDQKEDLSMIISSGKRLSNLVNDILDFSRLRNADLALQRRPVHLHAVADVVLRNLAPLAAGKNLELVNSVPEDTPPSTAMKIIPGKSLRCSLYPLRPDPAGQPRRSAGAALPDAVGQVHGGRHAGRLDGGGGDAGEVGIFAAGRSLLTVRPDGCV